VGDVHHLPTLGREFFIDDSGTVLRVSWHLDRGLVNLSVWRESHCTEAFQLPVADAARLISYLADGLATAASARTTAIVQPLTARQRLNDGVREVLARTVARVARPPR
jgi:hypothetical protein